MSYIYQYVITISLHCEATTEQNIYGNKTNIHYFKTQQKDSNGKMALFNLI